MAAAARPAGSWRTAPRLLDFPQTVARGVALEDAARTGSAGAVALDDRHRRVAGQRAAQLQFGLEVVDLLLQRAVLLVDRPHGQLVGGDVRLLLAGQQRALQQQGLLQHAGQRSLGREAPAQHVLVRSEEHTSELQSLMRISYAVFCLKKK